MPFRERRFMNSNTAAIRKLPPLSSRNCCDETDILEDVGVFSRLSSHSLGLLDPMAWHKPLATRGLVCWKLFCIAVGGVVALCRFQSQRLSFWPGSSRMVGDEF